MIGKRDTGSGSGRIASGFCTTPTEESAPPLSVSFPSRILSVCVHSTVVERGLGWEMIGFPKHSSNARQTDSYRSGHIEGGGPGRDERSMVLDRGEKL